jgi:hypothetical protein
VVDGGGAGNDVCAVGCNGDRGGCEVQPSPSPVPLLILMLPLAKVLMLQTAVRKMAVIIVEIDFIVCSVSGYLYTGSVVW